MDTRLSDLISQLEGAQMIKKTTKKSAQKPAPPTTRKRYGEEFKVQALERARRDGVAQAAQDLGLQAQQLYTWRARAEERDSLSEEQRTAQADLAKLKREVVRLSEENDFLKKVAAHFAKGSK
jgi:transposase